MTREAAILHAIEVAEFIGGGDLARVAFEVELRLSGYVVAPSRAPAWPRDAGFAAGYVD